MRQRELTAKSPITPSPKDGSADHPAVRSLSLRSCIKESGAIQGFKPKNGFRVGKNDCSVGSCPECRGKEQSTAGIPKYRLEVTFSAIVCIYMSRKYNRLHLLHDIDAWIRVD